MKKTIAIILSLLGALFNFLNYNNFLALNDNGTISNFLGNAQPNSKYGFLLSILHF